MSKHTAGPWQVKEENSGSHGIESTESAFIVGLARRLEDARLISRAPTMLTLLEESLMALSAYQTHPESCYDANEPDGGQPNGDCLRCRIRKEIEAARGFEFQAFRKAA